MKLTEPLTKENFFNEMMDTFPHSMKVFCNWIDEYKKEIEWENLFMNGIRKVKTKFHHLPYAMQQGIWIEFVGQTLHKYFEQPEYSYCGDLELDIKTVFEEMEQMEESYPEPISDRELPGAARPGKVTVILNHDSDGKLML